MSTDDISSSDLREVANQLSEQRAGQEVSVPTSAPADAGDSGDPDEGMSLKVAARRRAERVAREAEERASYERAAQLSERELPGDLDATDSELQSSELAALRAEMQAVRSNQDSSYARFQADHERAGQIQQTNQSYESSRQNAIAHNDVVQAQYQQEVQGLLETFGDLSEAQVAHAYQHDAFFRETFHAARGRIALAQQAQQQAVAGYAQNFEQLAQLHDQAFIAQNPDMQDPETRDAAAKGCIQMLREAGYSDEEIQMGWRLGHGTLSNIRSHAIQSGMLELWRGREAKRHLRDDMNRPKIATPVLRPGVGGSRPHAEAELRDLSRALTEKGSVRAAAKLLTAQRSYRRS